MKKRILLIFGISLLLLTGCVNINLDEDKKEPEIVENETNHQENVEDQTEDEDKASTEKEEKPSTEQGEKLNEKEYIINTFDEYGLKLKEGAFHVKHQGAKRVVILKEHRKNARPNISKFIFLEKEGKYDPVFLMVNNSVKYGSDNS